MSDKEKIDKALDVIKFDYMDFIFLKGVFFMCYSGFRWRS